MAVEINLVTKMVTDKRWALGNFAHENVVVYSNLKTVYESADSNSGYLYKFVTDKEKDLSSRKPYLYIGGKDGTGNSEQLNNSIIEERNSTLAKSVAVGAKVFGGIEDVEIGPDGMVYFAVKPENKVYRFQDSDP